MPVQTRFPWVAVSAVVTLLLIGAVAMLPGVDEAPSVVRSNKLPKLGLSRISRGDANELLTEQILAYDQAPLFIPSALNSNEPGLPLGIRPGAGGPFAEIPAQFNRSTPLSFPAKIKTPQTPVEGLSRTGGHDGLLALGRADAVEVNAERGVVRIEILKVGEADFKRSVELSTSAVAGVEDWQPLELMGALTREGYVGELVVTTSSGSSEIDDNFRSLLSQNVLLVSRLSIGFYTFRVGQ